MNCEACDGAGYVVATAQNSLSIIHGELVPEEDRNIAEIQKCDLCGAIADDDIAQEAFLHDLMAGKVKLPKYLLLYGKK